MPSKSPSLWGAVGVYQTKERLLAACEPAQRPVGDPPDDVDLVVGLVLAAEVLERLEQVERLGHALGRSVDPAADSSVGEADQRIGVSRSP